VAERTFLIQRYCSDMHPHVRGLRPFLVTGPSFTSWIVPGSIDSHGQHVLRPQVKRTLIEAFPPGGPHQRAFQHEAAAEVLLREGVIQALWSVDSPECLPEDQRWSESLRQAVRELPLSAKGWPEANRTGDGFWEIAEAVDELLSGMPSPAMAREYVAEDHLRLEPVEPPP
jgi:hypothetical protein